MLTWTAGEVREALFDLISGWAVGVRSTGPHYWRRRSSAAGDLRRA